MDESQERKPLPKLSKREKLGIWLPLMLGLAMATGIWLGFSIYSVTRQSYLTLELEGDAQAGARVNSKVEAVLRFIDAKYLENVPKQKLEEAAVRALLQQLDPHSSYIPADDLQGVNESLAGGFDGIGVEFFILKDTVHIVGVIPEGPSDQAGLKTGDKLIMVEDSTIAGVGITNKGIIQKLKGERGSQVKVKVLRPGKGLLDFSIERGEIPMPSVDLAYMLDKQTGYIRISRFSNKTYKEFMDALQDLIEKEGMKDLVIDLRQNPGGYLDAATNILTQLFDSKKLLVYTEGRNYRRKEYHSTGKNFFPVGKIAVLIDENSASASEIMAGALQDNDRGIIVGRRSFGKGLVQEQYTLSDGSGLRLTVAKYYTPSGRLIQKPYAPADREGYNNDIHERIESGELYNQDSVKFADTVKYYTTGGRVVYGGGGIMPDIFVPLDTVLRNAYFVRATEHIPSFIYGYLDGRRQYFERYKTWADFESYQPDAAMLEAFVAHAQERGLARDETALRRCREELSNYLKAYIGKQLFRDLGYHRSLHQRDKTLKRALEELQRGR